MLIKIFAMLLLSVVIIGDPYPPHVRPVDFKGVNFTLSSQVKKQADNTYELTNSICYNTKNGKPLVIKWEAAGLVDYDINNPVTGTRPAIIKSTIIEPETKFNTPVKFGNGYCFERSADCYYQSPGKYSFQPGRVEAYKLDENAQITCGVSVNSSYSQETNTRVLHLLISKQNTVYFMSVNNYSIENYDSATVQFSKSPFLEQMDNKEMYTVIEDWLKSSEKQSPISNRQFYKCRNVSDQNTELVFTSKSQKATVNRTSFISIGESKQGLIGFSALTY